MGKRFTGVFSRSKSTSARIRGENDARIDSLTDVGVQPGSSADNDYNFDNAPVDSPENNVGRSIRLFCESGSASNGGEEVLHLPVIVEAAESSPTAAAAAAQQIRRFLSREWASKPHVQYNSVMLIRILSDNPGPSFTRNFDKSFVSTVKECLKQCKDTATQQILRETLDTLEANKGYQEGMDGLIQMWRKEKGHNASFANPGNRGRPPRGGANDLIYTHPGMGPDFRPGPGDRSHSNRHRQLPPPVELASRIEEARNTAKILLQLIQSTPSEQVLNNDLLREFSDRCQSAQKSMSGYIACDNPPPDDETMLTLIETNEQLSLATSRYQRAILSARKASGQALTSAETAMMTNAIPATTPPAVAVGQEQSSFAPVSSPSIPKQQPTANLSAFGNSEEEFQAPAGPPPSQRVQQRTLSNDSDSFVPPVGPPPRKPRQPIGFSNNNDSFIPPPRMSPPRPTQVQPVRNGSGYSPPPSPPTAMLARLNSREGQTSPKRFEPQPVSDPFADPVEHDRNPAPLAYENPANRPHSNTFSVDGGPTYAPGNIVPSPVDPDDPYNVSPVQSRAGLAAEQPVSPISPSQQRWQDLRNNASTSYMGWRTSAADGLTGQAPQPVPEIDGHSEVGRTAAPPVVGRSNTNQSDAASSAYSVDNNQSRV